MASENAGRVAGKVAIVTGAARGTGEVTARLLAAEGAQVALLDVSDDAGAAVAKDLGDAAIYVHCDVSSEADWAAAVETTVDRFGRARRAREQRRRAAPGRASPTRRSTTTCASSG